ncbi:MAG TPA: DUF4190 domain-containing protein [Roseiflexaceae bacterium]
MNCTTCDTPLEPGALFCANCGARVAPAPSAAPPTIALPTADVPAYHPQPYGDQYGSSTPQHYTPPQQVVYAPVTPPSSNAATVSLVFGILSWCGLVLVGAIVAIIAGHKARNEIRASGGRIGGNGLATAGLILGYAHIAVLLLACVGFFLLILLGALASR